MTPALRPYQEIGARFLAANHTAYLADEPRVGKTPQAIVACDLVNANHVMVLCPASAVEMWKREFRRFLDCPPALTVFSYDSAIRFFKEMPKAPIDVLICDEAHYLKNPKAKRTKLVFGKGCAAGSDSLAGCASRVYLLSGTPMPKDPSELWPAIRALNEKAIIAKSGKPYNFFQFVQKYCRTRNNGFGIEILGAKNHDDLKARLNGFMLRRTLEEVAPEMPKLQYDDLFVDAAFPKGIPSEEIEMARKAVADGGIEALSKIAPHVATLRRLTGLAKVLPVVKWIEENVPEKIVLFAHHRAVCEGLAEGVGKVGFTWTAIGGNSSGGSRELAVRYFQKGKGQVFIGQIQAAGTAIRLDAADQVLFVEASWVPSDNYQASQRIIDVTKTRPCIARFVTIPNSLDEAIQRVTRRRTEDIQKILGGM